MFKKEIEDFLKSKELIYKINNSEALLKEPISDDAFSLFKIHSNSKISKTIEFIGILNKDLIFEFLVNYKKEQLRNICEDGFNLNLIEEGNAKKEAEEIVNKLIDEFVLKNKEIFITQKALKSQKAIVEEEILMYKNKKVFKMPDSFGTFRIPVYSDGSLIVDYEKDKINFIVKSVIENLKMQQSRLEVIFAKEKIYEEYSEIIKNDKDLKAKKAIVNELRVRNIATIFCKFPNGMEISGKVRCDSLEYGSMISDGVLKGIKSKDNLPKIIPIGCIEKIRWGRSDLYKKENFQISQTEEQQDELLIKYQEFDFARADHLKTKEAAYRMALAKKFKNIPEEFKKDKELIKRIMANADSQITKANVYEWMDDSLKLDFKFVDTLDITCYRPSFINKELFQDQKFLEYIYKHKDDKTLIFSDMYKIYGEDIFKPPYSNIFKKNTLIFDFRDDICDDAQKVLKICTKDSVFGSFNLFAPETITVELFKEYLLDKNPTVQELNYPNKYGVSLLNVFKDIPEINDEILKSIKYASDAQAYIVFTGIKDNDYENIAIMATYNHSFLYLLDKKQLKEFLECEFSEIKNVSINKDFISLESEYMIATFGRDTQFQIVSKQSNEYPGVIPMQGISSELPEMFFELMENYMEENYPGAIEKSLENTAKLEYKFQSADYSVLASEIQKKNLEKKEIEK